MTNAIGYRAADCPISIGTTFIKRVQAVEFSRLIPTTPVQEHGRHTSVGVIQDIIGYTARLTQYTIDPNALEEILAGVENPLPQDYIDATAVTVKGPYGGISGAKVSDIVYTAEKGGSPGTTVISLMGTGWTTGTVAVPAADLVTPGAYLGPDFYLLIDTDVELYRVQRVTVRLNLGANRLDEIHNAVPVGYAYDVPELTLEFEMVHYDETPAETEKWYPDQDSPTTFVFGIDGAVRTFTMENMVSTGEPTNSSVRGWASLRYAYQSKTGILTMS